jgi:hypothetical protein
MSVGGRPWCRGPTVSTKGLLLLKMERAHLHFRNIFNMLPPEIGANLVRETPYFNTGTP